MAIRELPVRSDIFAYTFLTTLEQNDYLFTLRFNSRQDRWIMDIQLPDETDLLIGIPLLVSFPLTFRFRDTRLPPGQFFVIDETGQERNPTRDNLGTDIKLLYSESA